MNRTLEKTNANRSRMQTIFLLCILLGVAAFLVQVFRGEAARAWQAYLISFLLFSALAHGALLFSTLMHTVKARWSGQAAAVAESFSAFLPVSLILFLVLFLGGSNVFPWIGQDLHGKEVWLNLPFLFGRDLVGLLVLYGLGLGYVYYTRLAQNDPDRPAAGLLARRIRQRLSHSTQDPAGYERVRTILGILYMVAFALVLSLLGYDLVMSADPHWYSTLFGAYFFIKAVYVGFGALIILAAVLHTSAAHNFTLTSNQFHDLGKLFFGFCLVWADFFYVQFVVIWYGNISEETTYIIERTMAAPWRPLAWGVFIVCFVGPFLVLLNKKIKTVPVAMIAICSIVIAGMWLEHFLLLGPALFPHAHAITVGWMDPLIAVGFFGLMATAITGYFRQFPELLDSPPPEGR